MLRLHWMTSSAAAKNYFAKTDYYATCPGEWLGKGSEMLGLVGSDNQMHFYSLADNLHPQTGQPLTTYTRDNRRVGMDLTFNSTKSVGIARELAGRGNAGDPLIEAAHREAVAYAMGFVEKDMQARVRVGGKDEDRVTGNMVAYRVTHRDTRISAEDQRPDMSLHCHVFCFNATFDPVEQKWKAAQMGDIKKDACYYEAIFHSRLAHNLKELGYGIRRDGKAFEITGIDRPLIEKFSRRTKYIKAVAEKLGIKSPKVLDKLGATTRLGKAKDLVEDLRSYFVSRLTDKEKQELTELKGQPSYHSTDEKAVRYAIGHVFERQSVVDEKRLYETAIRHGIGSVTPEGVQKEAKRQGVLLKGGEATTREVLAEESKVIAYARDGRGTCKPMGLRTGLEPALPTRDEERNRTAQPYPNAVAPSDIATLPEFSQGGERLPAGRFPSGVPNGTAPRTDTDTVGSFGQQKGQSIRESASTARRAEGTGRDESATRAAFGQQKGRSDESKRPVGHSTRPSDIAAIPAAQPPSGTRGLTGVDYGQVPKRDTATLSPEQQAKNHFRRAPKLVLSSEQAAIARHVWESPDRVILIRGAAGTGKTHTMNATIDGIDKPVVVLAPSAEASRGVLRKEGFAEADTVSRFLEDETLQQKGRGGVIWVDEAGLLGIRQVAQIFDLAKELNARVVLQGDRKQHGSIERGATLRVLEEFAGLPVAELKDVRRQRGEYKSAVESLAKGKILEGFDKLDALGWVKEVDGNGPLVRDYLSGLDSKKDILVIAPTHIEGDEITRAIREKLKERGVVGKDEQMVETLRPLGWTEAERGDPERYDGTEVLQFHRNSGTHRAGDRVEIAECRAGVGNPKHFNVYRREDIGLAPGDSIRITTNGKDLSGRHKLNNGSRYTIKGFDKEGNIALTNGWTIGKGFPHIAHGYVSTSHAAQGRTVDRVLIAMGTESLPAMGSEQFYVSVSRGRESAKIYTDLPNLREAILRTDKRKSATELLKPKRKPSRAKQLLEKVRQKYRELREKALDVLRDREQHRGLSYGR